MGVSCLAPLGGESCRLGAHDDGRGLTHVVVVVFVGVLQLGGEDTHAMLFEEGDTLLRGTDGGWHAEYTTDAGPDEVGVIKVGERIAHDDGIDPSSFGCTEDSPEIARLLNAL